MTPPGWDKLITDMMKELDPYKDHICFEQIKSKFAELRVYYSLDGVPKDIEEKIAAIVKRYESLSKTTCEMCGAKGKHCSIDNWEWILCSTCLMKKVSASTSFPLSELFFRADGRIEWQCKHAVGHPVYVPEGLGMTGWIHGCDWCCKGHKHEP